MAAMRSGCSVSMRLDQNPPPEWPQSAHGTFSPSFALPPPFPTIPADHVDNPFGVPVGYIGRPLGPDYGGARNTADLVRKALLQPG